LVALISSIVARACVLAGECSTEADGTSEPGKAGKGPPKRDGGGSGGGCIKARGSSPCAAAIAAYSSGFIGEPGLMEPG
jgi:hypothetical protein